MKWALTVAFLVFSCASAESPFQEIAIDGTLSYQHHQTYLEHSFEVPPGIDSLTVDLEHDGEVHRTVIDIGLVDPEGFRGWTGSNKSHIVISSFDSTPGYRGGPILSGTWTLLLGIPNIRENVETDYKATVRLYQHHDLASALNPGGDPILAGARWYRGDLHTHTGHSDGYCLSEKGVAVPCPVHLTVEAAAAANLDFLAITDHNSLSHHQSIRELQPYYDRMLLVPGREITTFFGHANVFGASSFIDFRIGPTTGRTINNLLADVGEQGALFSINHPALPSGESCMGCGWQLPSVDFRSVDAIEVVNGGASEFWHGSSRSERGIEFWQSILDQGIRITAIGGSDNHDPKLTSDARQSPVGVPATVVYADGLTQASLFAGIRSGRVYVDLSGDVGRVVDLKASFRGSTVNMGGNLLVRRGEKVALEIRVVGGSPGDRVVLIAEEGKILTLQDARINSPDETKMYVLESDGAYQWVRANVRSPDGRLLLLSNPIYFNVPGGEKE